MAAKSKGSNFRRPDLTAYIFSVAAVFLLLTSVIVSASDTGGEAFAFLQNGVGTRATGMGSAYCAVSDDMSAVLYNPAGLVKLPDLQMMAETYIMSFGRSVNFLSVGKVFPIGKSMYSAGFSWLNYSAGSDIEMRKTDSDTPDNLFSDSSNIFIFTAATYLGKNLFFGGNFKILTESIEKERGSGVGFDLGLYLEATKNFTAGFCVNNISSTVNWSDNAHVDNLASEISCGLSYNAQSPGGINGLDVIADTDLDFSSFGYINPKCGVEIAWNRTISIRTGFDRTVSAGAGVKLKPSEMLAVKIDYAFRPDTVLPGDSNHRLGLTIDYVFPRWGMVEDALGERVPGAEDLVKNAEQPQIKVQPETPVKEDKSGAEDNVMKVNGYEW